jgi:hypothetical protein
MTAEEYGNSEKDLKAKGSTIRFHFGNISAANFKLLATFTCKAFISFAENNKFEFERSLHWPIDDVKRSAAFDSPEKCESHRKKKVSLT